MKLTFLKKRSKPYLIGLGLWWLLVLFFSARFETEYGTWTQSLKLSASEWITWLFFAPLIIRLNQKLPFPRDAFGWRFLCHIPLSLCVGVLTTILGDLTRGGITDIFSLPVILTRVRFHAHVLIYWIIIVASIVYEYKNLLNEQLIEKAELERSLTEARLETLRSQMHPHFLFNALNTISANVERNPKGSRRMLEQLGELLRFSLDYSHEQMFTLIEEMAFIDRYLALQKARFEERLDVNVTVAPDTLNARVPTFILEPLVENAIHHGIAPRSQKGVVEIQASKEKDRLHLSVRDDGPGLPPDWKLEQDAGIGINNTCQRLRCLYGDDHFLFNITNVKEGGVLAEIMLPFNPGDDLA